MKLTVEVDGAAATIEFKDAERAAAITWARNKRNAALVVDVGGDVENHKDFIASNMDYLAAVLADWSENNPDATLDDVLETLLRATKSWKEEKKREEEENAKPAPEPKVRKTYAIRSE